MAKPALRIGRLGTGRAMAVCLALAATASLSAESPSRFLEIVREVPIIDFGVGLDIAIGPQDTVYLSGESTGGVWRLVEETGQWRSLLPPHPHRDLPRHPKAIATDNAGNLWLADYDRHRVAVMAPDGNLIRVYDDRGKTLRRPSRLDRLDATLIAAWDSDSGASVFLSQAGPMITGRVAVPASAFCLPGDAATSYCVAEDRASLVKRVQGQTVATWKPDDPNVRVGDLARSADGEIFLTDTPRRRILALSPDLGSITRFRLYESILLSPTAIALAGDRLWLVDEGRKSVLGFRLRTAESAWEHAILGEEYLALFLYEPALAELTRAARLGLRHPDLSLNTGIALYGLGRYEEALAAWGSSPEEDVALNLWRGNALFRLGRFTQAIESYSAMPPDAADYHRARFNLAQSYLAAGQNEPARAELAALRSIRPDDGFVNLSLARALAALGRSGEAAGLLASIADVGPAARQARYYLGHLRLTVGDARSALPLLEQAAKEGPYFRAAMRDLARAYQQLGDAERSQFYEQRAASLQDDARVLERFLLEDQS